MLPQTDPTTVHTTIGELASALYEEAFSVFGDEDMARRVASEVLEDVLARKRR